MATSENSDGSSDWEEIRNPYNIQPSSPQQDGQHFGFELVIRDDYYNDGSSVFPPSDHEDLPLLPEESLSTEQGTSTSSPLAVSSSDTGSPKQQQIKSDSKLLVKMGEIRIGICTAGKRMFKVFASSIRCQMSSGRLCASFVHVTALAVALFACMKIIQWRNNIMLLIREKDQRISQLLSQIAHMNEILSARRKVPILRIN